MIDNDLVLINRFICMTKDIGVHGNLFGGVLLSKIDEAAALFAVNECKTPRMVTLKIEELIFEKPIKVGQCIDIYGKVIKVGNSSINIYIECIKPNLYVPEKYETVCRTTITFVKIDEDGRPIPI